MSAVLSHQAAPQADVSVRLAFQKQLQAVTNKIHATEQPRRDHARGERRTSASCSMRTA